MSSWHSYPKIYALGHRYLRELLSPGDDYLVQEKIDGSQFSFGIYDGVLRARSKGQEINLASPDKMFRPGIEAVQARVGALVSGWAYRGEYLQKPKHNTIAYSRIPANHIALFDISTGLEEYAPYNTVASEATRLGFDVVPVLHAGRGLMGKLESILETESFLGGHKIEGIVVKNYNKFGEDKHVLMGKYVSEAFKEANKRQWRGVGKGDIVDQFAAVFGTERRWEKAVEHLRDQGILEGSPRDIGPLIGEVRRDITSEELDWIRERIFTELVPAVLKQAARGLPEWYKKRLAEGQPDEPDLLEAP